MKKYPTYKAWTICAAVEACACILSALIHTDTAITLSLGFAALTAALLAVAWSDRE